MKCPIYTFGDSHADFGWRNIPGVIIKYFGPKTMYGFGKRKEIIVKDIPKNAIAVFSYGEIDCRCHVNKYQPWENTIDNLVREYIETIKLNSEIHRNIYIYGVPPPVRKGSASEVSAFPFIGSDDERLSYVKYMNEKLENSPYRFINIYRNYSDEDGFLNMMMSDGHVHITNEIYLLEWLERNTNEMG